MWQGEGVWDHTVPTLGLELTLPVSCSKAAGWILVDAYLLALLVTQWNLQRPWWSAWTSLGDRQQRISEWKVDHAEWAEEDRLQRVFLRKHCHFRWITSSPCVMTLSWPRVEKWEEKCPWTWRLAGGDYFLLGGEISWYWSVPWGNVWGELSGYRTFSTDIRECPRGRMSGSHAGLITNLYV